MFNALKSAREELQKKEERLEELGKIPQERAWKPEEMKEYETVSSEIEAKRNEIDLLEKEEKRKLEAAKRSAEGKKEEERGIDPEPKMKIEVTNDHLKTPEARNAKVFSLIQGVVIGDQNKVQEARKALVEGGHYDDVLKGPEGEKRSFSTLTDGKGGVFLPTSVSRTILDMSQQYGVVPANSFNLGNIIQNEVRVPQVLGRPSFSAVNQGSAITGSSFNFGGIALKASKWGTIIDWTNEVDESIGAIIMPKIMEKVAEAWSYVADNAFFNGDGTSTYNGINGLEELEGTVDYVQRVTAATGNTSFATVDATDYNSLVYALAPAARNGAIIVTHPNQLENIRNLQDGQGKYIYGDPSAVNPVGSMWGYRIVLSEAFPFTDGTNKTVAAMYNPNYLAYATGRNLTTTRLVEGSFTDENSNTVNLASQDAQAVRITGLFDMQLATLTRDVGGTNYGAFAVLRTTS